MPSGDLFGSAFQSQRNNVSDWSGAAKSSNSKLIIEGAFDKERQELPGRSLVAEQSEAIECGRKERN